jgi:hypothetical protein
MGLLGCGAVGLYGTTTVALLFEEHYRLWTTTCECTAVRLRRNRKVIVRVKESYGGEWFEDDGLRVKDGKLVETF